MKKPKLDAGTEDAEEELPEEEGPDEPAASAAMDVDAPAAGAAEPKIRFKKGKTAEGASAHFKENPYTFIAPDDPIVQACVYVMLSHRLTPLSILLAAIAARVLPTGRTST